MIDATGSRRRLQALAVMGHGAAAVHEASGLGTHHWDYIVKKATTVRPATAERVTAAYDELWDKPGSLRIAKRARAQGWLGPLDWDDDAIDDPAAEPATKRIMRAVGRPEPVEADDEPEAVEDAVVEDEAQVVQLDLGTAGIIIARLRRHGLDDDAIGEALDLHRTTVARIASWG